MNIEPDVIIQCTVCKKYKKAYLYSKTNINTRHHVCFVCGSLKSYTIINSKSFGIRKTKKQRKCLMCEEDFTSISNDNRVCNLCKRKDVWVDGRLF